MNRRPAAPVRIVHLGLGSFVRAHAAWYTEHAPDRDGWGIAAFTGRSPDAAVALAAQDAVYSLLVRGPDGARVEVISTLSAVHPADDVAALCDYLARPEVAVVTLTVTEAGYRAEAPVISRLAAGLAARRAAGAGAIAVVPCDNVPDNGAVLADVVGAAADRLDPSLRGWIDEHVSFVSTMVDRITPRTTDDDRAEAARLLGAEDPLTVVTEEFSEWVLAGVFPAGRPRWEAAGARFVDDVHPFERRKLLLLNGAHSLMAYAGSLRGHDTIAEAFADPEVRRWVEDWWDVATPLLGLAQDEVTAYRGALRERFATPGLRHRLAQVAADGSQKVRIRAVPVIEAGLVAGGPGRPDPRATLLVAAWVAHLRGHGVDVDDADAEQVLALARGSADDAVARVLDWLGLPVEDVAALVRSQLDDLVTGSGTGR